MAGLTRLKLATSGVIKNQQREPTHRPEQLLRVAKSDQLARVRIELLRGLAGLVQSCAPNQNEYRNENCTVSVS
jgi:hypothetical protein